MVTGSLRRSRQIEQQNFARSSWIPCAMVLSDLSRCLMTLSVHMGERGREGSAGFTSFHRGVALRRKAVPFSCKIWLFKFVVFLEIRGTTVEKCFYTDCIRRSSVGVSFKVRSVWVNSNQSPSSWSRMGASQRQPCFGWTDTVTRNGRYLNYV